MAVFTQQQRKLTGKLITSLTGFSASEENYKLCFQFCKSNFQYHRFLDVNDMQINRSISGLVEKFHVHSQPQKADSLQQLTDQFLSSSLEHSYPRSDAHYGTLSLLLALSHSPLHATYQPATPTLPAEGEEEEFDWASYLMEGIEYSPQHSSGSEWSDSDSERDGASHSYHQHPDDHSPHKGREDLTDEGIGTELCQESESWLTEYLTFPYWDSRQQSVLQQSVAPLPAPSAHSSCHLARKWSAHVVNSDPFSRPVEAVQLSEAQVVRETIWLLLGAEATYVYYLDNDTIKVKSDVCISHLTPLALRSLLSHFAVMGTWLHQMRGFCSVVLRGGGGGGEEEYPRCRTYEAFASGLHGCLDQILSSVRTLEAQLVKKEKTVTLLMLAEACHVTYELVNRLYELFHQGIVSALRDSSGPSDTSSSPDSRKCSSQLLDCLWVGLEHFDLLGETGEEMLNILYPLWAKTICPYMEMLDGWMTCGIIRDIFNEFCVIRNPQLEIRAPNYWEECFTLAPGATPTFLSPVATEILLAGKSMNVIESIGKLKQIQEGVVHSSPSKGGVASPTPSDKDVIIVQTPPTTLYEDFLRSMSDIGSSGGREDLAESCDWSCDLPGEEAGWEVRGVEHYDPLMNAYLDQIKADTTPPACGGPRRGVGGEVILPKFCLIPLNLLIQDHLYPLLQQHYRTASGALVDMLRSEFNLLAHVCVVQQYFLMEAGAVMHHFTHELFQNFLAGEDWEDPSYLNAVFEEAVQTCWGSQDDGHRFEKWISVTSSPPGAPPPALTDSTTGPLPLSLFLQYTPPWPLDMLFSWQVLGTYNRLFQLLLTLRWTKWNLEGVTTRLNTLEAFQALKPHLLFLLRSRLLHFVNSLCSYIMARVLHSVGAEFQHSVAMAIDLDSILSLHSTYLSTICDRCFLNQKASMVYQAIETVLSLGVRFRQCWEKGVAEFSVQEAEEIEAEFSRCCHFIVSCLNKTVRQGSHPHCKALQQKPGVRVAK